MSEAPRAWGLATPGIVEVGGLFDVFDVVRFILDHRRCVFRSPAPTTSPSGRLFGRLGRDGLARPRGTRPSMIEHKVAGLRRNNVEGLAGLRVIDAFVHSQGKLPQDVLCVNYSVIRVRGRVSAKLMPRGLV